ncbi:MAG: hypothetical protein ACPHQ9_03570 [Marinobacter sp.]|uniref:hypothetical protein n=1 Tax=Marinobacter sp. TaxID=50741 RepID=UPI003C4506DD
MGNRGVLHNSKREITRQFKASAWITCLLEFKGRQRELMSPGAYTELFFLDEVTAFAAGHRPCAECRRTRYNEFRDIWQEANAWTGDGNVRAPELDKVLHEERLAANKRVTWTTRLDELPHGAMFLLNNEAHAICGDRVLVWSFAGYCEVSRENGPDMVEVLTPRSVVKAFAGGFKSEFHPSAMS